MKRKQKLIALLLVMSMGFAVFSDAALAKEPVDTEVRTETAAEITDAEGAAEGKRPAESGTGTEGQETGKGDGAQSEKTEGNPEENLKAEQPAEEKDAADTARQSESENEAEPEEADITEEVQDADFDDPGRGRLGGYDVPEEFYGSSMKMRAASSVKHDSRFNGYTIKQGIDVSKWNKTVNWTSVKNAGIEFAFVRTSYRGTETGKLAKDETAATNMTGAAAAGVKVGAYIFSQAITKAEAVAEADYLLQTVKGYNITMPLVFDFEYYAGGRLSKAKLSRRAQTDICLAFCDRIKEAGYTPLVYANYSMLKDDLYASEITAKYPVWLARYNSTASYDGEYDFWQYTSEGKVSGISGNVDMNYWYIKPGDNMLFGTGSSSSAQVAAPATPSLSGKADSYDRVKLSWKKVSGASGYILYRYDSSKKKYVRIKTAGSSTTSYTDTGRSMGTTYKYKIKSYKKASGQTVYSSASKEVSVKTESTMTGKVNSSGVAVRSGPSTSKKRLKSVGRNTGVTITGTSGNWYKISIKISGKKKTGYIKKSYVTIIRKPTLSVASVSKSKIKLKWNKISGASGYEIQRYNSSKKKYTTVKTISKGSTTSYTNSSLKKNTTYKYRIRSYKKVKGKKIYSYYCSAKSGKTTK